MARWYLLLLGLVTLILGLLYAVVPTAFTGPSGFGTLSPEALTDLRATYGGLQIAAGAYLLWTSRRRDRHRAGVLLAGVLFTSVAASRAFGLVVDGNPTKAMVGALAFELVMAAASWFLLARVPRGVESRA